MSRIIRPVVSPRGRVILLSGGTLWLIAAMLLSATPDGAVADEGPPGAAESLITAFEEVGGVGILYRPRVITDALEQVWIIDPETAQVARIGSIPNPVAELVIGRKGAGPGEFIRPRDLVVDGAGNIFVGDEDLGRISKFASDGTFLTSVALHKVSSLAIDSRGRILAYPGRDAALLQRFDNDLVGEEPLLEKTDAEMHRNVVGVLMAMDRNDRLYLLDQAGPRVVVYDRDMRQVDGWAVEAPGLLDAMESRRNQLEEKLKALGGGRIVALPGIQAMALDPMSGQVVFAYLVPQETGQGKVSRVASYSTTGVLGLVRQRSTKVHANAFAPGGYLLEADAEKVSVWRPPITSTSGAN